MPRNVNMNGHIIRVYDEMTPTYVECDLEHLNDAFAYLDRLHPQARTDCIYDAYGNVVMDIDRSDTTHEEMYTPDMPGMTLDEFQAWSDQVIRDATSSRPDVDTPQHAEHTESAE